MQHDPRQPTQPFQRARTTPFGDAFVSSGGGPSPNVTRPLRSPTGPLKDAVSAKLIEVKQELDYVRHLMTLFAPSIAILRFAVHLTTLPQLPTMESLDQPAFPLEPVATAEDPEIADGEPVDSEPMAPEPVAPAPDPFVNLGIPQKKFGLDIATVLARDLRVKQRAQVALYQYDEVVRAYEDGNQTIDSIATCAFEEAWERLQELGIERTKGKAYAVCGFWDNFKNDPVICKLFPPPTPQNTRGTQPLSMNSGNLPSPGSGQLPKPAPAAPKPPSAEPNGLLGKLKGFFK
jgi:hypothetical protein